MVARREFIRDVGLMRHDLLFLSLASFSLLIHTAEPATNQQDVTALIALHNAWGGNPSSWDTSTDPCDPLWLGIACDATNTSITQLILINQGLVGTLPSAIGDLSNLTNLDLSSNSGLGGSLPAEISNLKSLQRLFLQFCNFSGRIPQDIGNLTALQYLGLTQNALTGPLPSTIGLLTSLFWLDVSTNKLNGSLPDSSTSATGSGLDNLTAAAHFHLENNEFSGAIPASIFNNQMQLLHLLLNNNKLTGNISPNIGALPHTEIIRLDFNGLSGSIPSGISAIKNLSTLQVNNNNLNGSLPDLSNNTKLQILSLGNNNFNASSIPSWITKLANLYVLSMNSANLIGSIPVDIFNSSSHISNVTLASNSLNGTLDLPSSNGSLLVVNVTDNKLTNFTSTGTFTAQILLEGNPYCNTTTNQSVCGSSPSSVPSSSSSTNASGCTNTCQENYMVNPKSASSNCQCVRPVVGNMEFLATKLAVLEDYNLTIMEEQFAAEMSDMNFLNVTILNSQVVVDAITATQATVYVFPPNNTDMWSPSDALLISYAIKSQQFSFTGVGPMVCAFIGAPYTAVIVVSGLSAGAKAGIAIAVVVIAAVMVAIAVYAMKQRKRAMKAEDANKPFVAWIAASEGGVAQIPQLKGARWFSLEEIRQCTNNFSRSNEIGEGGYGKVYKGFLPSGDKVAVKRAGAESLQGATEFKNEIELLSRVHHRNLVGLIGFCFEEGEQMLVYEFMPNGTLRECLSGSTGIRMDWERRIALALNSARGIAYLHTEANPPIIHRDIKSSNILLDDKLVAKVADFGLSVLAPNDDAVAPSSSQVKGTLGYLDPDYFMTNRLTDKSDVYSFGVVLLELVTSRLPIQSGKYVVREMRTAIAQGGMDRVVKSMVDPELNEYPQKAMEKLVELALACVKDSPNERPTMVEVMKELESLLSEVPSTKLDDVSLEEKYARTHEDKLWAVQQNFGTAFDYSGSYIGMSTNIEPK